MKRRQAMMILGLGALVSALSAGCKSEETEPVSRPTHSAAKPPEIPVGGGKTPNDLPPTKKPENKKKKKVEAPLHPIENTGPATKLSPIMAD